MNDEIEETKEHSTRENLEALGQLIAGELELVGGILTADPISQAEGEFNVEVGQLHLETTDELAEGDETNDANQTE